MTLENILGIRLIFWIGSTVPAPPPRSVLDALSQVQVTNDAKDGDGFQLTFTLGKEKALDYDLISSGVVKPMTRVLIGVVLGVVPEVLIDGIVTHHQFLPSDEPGMSTLTVTGTNLTVMLDLDERNEPYKNQPDSVIVTQLLLNHAQLGLIPDVTTTTDIPIELYRIPRQHETDLAFIRRMAERNGFVFYIEPVTFGVNNAHWGPETRFGIPKPALTKNMGSATNTRDLSFSNDALAAVGASGTFIEPLLGMTIPIPSLPSLRIPPLSAFPETPNRTVLLRDTAKKEAGQAALALISTVTDAGESIGGNGVVDTVNYGSILRARDLVGVRGAGFSYDGNYEVRSVTHDIAKGSYTQSFVLKRDGMGALFPTVLT
jgi:hypothetical protein